MLKIMLALTGFLYAFSAHAVPQFSPEEIAEHQAKLSIITETAARCLDNTYAEHQAFYERYNASKFYGNRRPDYKTVDQRAAALKRAGFSDAKAFEIARQQIGTACITMTEVCLQQGFMAAGGLSVQTWKKMMAHLLAVDHLGTDLQLMLRSLGWKLYYWNPSADLQQMARWDAEDRRLTPLTSKDIAAGRSHKPVWGNHVAHYVNATTKGKYYTFPVDDAQALVGFGDQPPEAFANVPFFVGIAHVGYHVFPGRYGEVIEAHSMRDLTSIDNMEFSVFNPLGKGGGPKWTATEKYRSGLIAVPYDL